MDHTATLPNPPIEWIEEEKPIIECTCGSRNIVGEYRAYHGFRFQGCKDCGRVWRIN